MSISPHLFPVPCAISPFSPAGLFQSVHSDRTTYQPHRAPSPPPNATYYSPSSPDSAALSALSPQTISSNTKSASSASHSPTYTCYACNAPYSDFEKWVDHLITHSAPSRFLFCYLERCPRATIGFRLRKDFVRHLNTGLHVQCTPAVRSRCTWQCRCGRQFTRKDNFRNHFRKNNCIATEPFMYCCSCGYTIDSREEKATATFDSHFEPCGKRPKGRKPGSGSSPTNHST
ncbi:hypothetical protein F5Y16DRAFT_42155 [Xylariaceae sp. FL0255]|nr:hypothetical protein F5Y16DRAFT_42155 [Xylariaceae sp. FL0255]